MKRHDVADVAAYARFEKVTRCYQLWVPQPSARVEPAHVSAAVASWLRPVPAMSPPRLLPGPDAARQPAAVSAHHRAAAQAS